MVYAPPRTAITAAAREITDRSEVGKLRRIDQQWQQISFGYYNTVGECWYAAQFYARALAKLRLYAGRRGEQGQLEEIEDPNDEAVQIWDRVRDTNGGRSQLQASYGRLMFLAGEGYLTVSNQDDAEIWEFLSSSELKLEETGSGARFWRLRAPGLTREDLSRAPNAAFEAIDETGETRVWRMWRRHPEYSMWADSPMRGVLGMFEDLVLLRLAVGARAKSRASGAGILKIPTEISFGSPEGQGDEDPERDPFVDALTTTMVNAIKDPGTAASVVPIVVQGDAESLKALDHLKLYDPQESYPERELRDELVKRIATGLDLPPEILLGLSDANHWTAWQIDDQTWTAHLQPIAQQMVDDFTTAYLRPAAKEAGIADWEDLHIGYDAADVVNHPDRAKDAKDVHDRGALSNAKLREVTGFTDDDAPDDEEHAEWLAIKLRSPELLGEDGEVEEEESEPEADNAAEVAETPPSEERLEDEDAPLAVSGQLIGAAQMATIRCRELAGSRIRSKLKGKKEDALIDGVANALVASMVGQQSAPVVSVEGGADSFRSYARGLGYAPAAAGRLGDIIERHALKTLFEEAPSLLPAGFDVQAAKLNGRG